MEYQVQGNEGMANLEWPVLDQSDFSLQKGMRKAASSVLLALCLFTLSAFGQGVIGVSEKAMYLK